LRFQATAASPREARRAARNAWRNLALLGAVAAWLCVAPAARAQSGFGQWLESLWPEAQAQGVSRRTFDAATRGLTPDLSLPDLAVPGRAQSPPRGQAEFVQTPAEYVRESSIARLAEHGRKLLAQHNATLARIDRMFGVPPAIMLAIWGRETDFGRYKNSLPALRVLATQAFYGRRKELFREEFVLALKMVEDGHAPLTMKSSWAGAMGLTQFLPSDFYKHAVDFDGDGRRDIFGSVPDALASAAKQLVDKGWQRDAPWAIEVRAPKNVDCTVAEPDVAMPVSAWIARGFTPAYDRKLKRDELAADASLLLPEGTFGPAFLTPKNFFVIKSYNFSDLYVLFVGHLADRILRPRPFETPWAKIAQLRTSDVEAMQRKLAEGGYYSDKIDGKAGMKTRAALGAYQKANGLSLDCWPTAAVLRHMRNRR
jgi:lytic murein transglycosylase